MIGEEEIKSIKERNFGGKTDSEKHFIGRTASLLIGEVLKKERFKRIYSSMEVEGNRMNGKHP